MIFYNLNLFELITKMKINDPNSKFTQRKYSQRMKNNQNNAMSNNEFDFQTYQNVQKMSLNSPFEDIYLGNGEMEDQIQSYKEQLIDAKLKNIKLTNEVQKLKELSKTQMSNFYNGIDKYSNSNRLFVLQGQQWRKC